jgi:hypothetical protein
MLNPKLEPNDHVILLMMPDEPGMLPGLKGVVIRKSVVFGVEQYDVQWENGRTLAILSDADTWMLDKNFKRKIKESMDPLTSNLDAFNNFNMGFLVKFLMVLRESGIVNMFGAPPYLWMGRDRIESKHKYDPIAEDNEKYEELLDLANEAQSKMIQGVMKVLESQNKEVDIPSINHYLRKYSQKILDVYKYRMGSQ